MEIKTYTPENHYIKALIYGASGSGKTRFAGTAIDKDNSKTLFLSAEGGLLSIKDKRPKYIEINTIENLLEAYNYLANEKHKFETVILDSITEISNVLKLEIENKEGHSMQLQDWGLLKNQLTSIFRNFRDLPMNVILLAQEAYITDEDKIKKIVPSLDGKGATSALPYFMDIVGYIKVDVQGNSIMRTNNRINLVTKDRSGCIGDDCPFDFKEWEKRIKGIKIKKQEVEEIKIEKKPMLENGTTDYKTLLKNELKTRGARIELDECAMIARATGEGCIKFPPTNNLAKKVYDKIKNSSVINNNPSIK